MGARATLTPPLRKALRARAVDVEKRRAHAERRRIGRSIAAIRVIKQKRPTTIVRGRKTREALTDGPASRWAEKALGKVRKAHSPTSLAHMATAAWVDVEGKRSIAAALVRRVRKAGTPTNPVDDVAARIAAALRTEAKAYESGAMKGYLGLAEGVSAEAGQLTLDSLGINQTWRWTGIRDVVPDLYQARGSKIIQGMYGQHIDTLAGIAARAANPGNPLTMGETAARIDAEWSGMTRGQVSRIARTETAVMWETTAANTYALNGITYKEWLDAGAEDDLCLDNVADGAILMEDTFTSGDTEPPAHPNCVCDLLPVLQAPDGEQWLPPAQPFTGNMDGLPLRSAPVPGGGPVGVMLEPVGVLPPAPMTSVVGAPADSAEAVDIISTRMESRGLKIATRGDQVGPEYQGSVYAHNAEGRVVARFDYSINSRDMARYADGLSETRPEAFIRFVEVDPAWRGQGLASDLYERARLVDIGGADINPGMLTDDGATWWRNIVEQGRDEPLNFARADDGKAVFDAATGGYEMEVTQSGGMASPVASSNPVVPFETTFEDHGVNVSVDAMTKGGAEVGNMDLVRTAKGDLRIKSVNVAEDFQRQGVATRMLEDVHAANPDAIIYHRAAEMTDEARAWAESLPREWNMVVDSNGVEIRELKAYVVERPMPEYVIKGTSKATRAAWDGAEEQMRATYDSVASRLSDMKGRWNGTIKVGRSAATEVKNGWAAGVKEWGCAISLSDKTMAGLAEGNPQAIKTFAHELAHSFSTGSGSSRVYHANIAFEEGTVEGWANAYFGADGVVPSYAEFRAPLEVVRKELGMDARTFYDDLIHQPLSKRQSYLEKLVGHPVEPGGVQPRGIALSDDAARANMFEPFDDSQQAWFAGRDAAPRWTNMKKVTKLKSYDVPEGFDFGNGVRDAIRFTNEDLPMGQSAVFEDNHILINSQRWNRASVEVRERLLSVKGPGEAVSNQILHGSGDVKKFVDLVEKFQVPPGQGIAGAPLEYSYRAALARETGNMGMMPLAGDASNLSLEDLWRENIADVIQDIDNFESAAVREMSEMSRTSATKLGFQTNRTARIQRARIQEFLDALEPAVDDVVRFDMAAVKPHPDLTARIAEENARDAKIIGNRMGWSPGEVQKSAVKAAQKVVDDARISIRVNGDDIASVLKDGRIKSQFETSKSSGWFDMDERAHIEERMFGYATDLPKAERPVYGYLSDAAKVQDYVGVDNYGRVEFIMKDAVKERSTLTMGDSFDLSYVPSPVNKIGPQSLDYMHNNLGEGPWEKILRDGAKDITDLEESWYHGYVETQVHGGVDIASDVDFARVWNMGSDTKAEFAAREAAFEDAGWTRGETHALTDMEPGISSPSEYTDWFPPGYGKPKNFQSIVDEARAIVEEERVATGINAPHWGMVETSEGEQIKVVLKSPNFGDSGYGKFPGSGAGHERGGKIIGDYFSDLYVPESGINPADGKLVSRAAMNADGTVAPTRRMFENSNDFFHMTLDQRKAYSVELDDGINRQRVLDYLTGNTDRHQSNYLIQTLDDGTHHVISIDNEVFHLEYNEQGARAVARSALDDGYIQPDDISAMQAMVDDPELQSYFAPDEVKTLKLRVDAVVKEAEARGMFAPAKVYDVPVSPNDALWSEPLREAPIKVGERVGGGMNDPRWGKIDLGDGNEMDVFIKSQLEEEQAAELLAKDINDIGGFGINMPKAVARDVRVEVEAARAAGEAGIGDAGTYANAVVMPRLEAVENGASWLSRVEFEAGTDVEELKALVDAQRRRIDLFDKVVGNADRNNANWMVDADGKVWAIDNGLIGGVDTNPAAFGMGSPGYGRILPNGEAGWADVNLTNEEGDILRALLDNQSDIKALMYDDRDWVAMKSRIESMLDNNTIDGTTMVVPDLVEDKVALNFALDPALDERMGVGKLKSGGKVNVDSVNDVKWGRVDGLGKGGFRVVVKTKGLYGDTYFGAENELGAQIVNDALGAEGALMPRVAVKAAENGEEQIIVARIDEAMTHKGLEKVLRKNIPYGETDPLSFAKIEDMRRASMLDRILGNTDRHLGNVMYTYDEATGEVRMYAIDHGLTLTPRFTTVLRHGVDVVQTDIGRVGNAIIKRERAAWVIENPSIARWDVPSSRDWVVELTSQEHEALRIMLDNWPMTAAKMSRAGVADDAIELALRRTREMYESGNLIEAGSGVGY